MSAVAPPAAGVSGATPARVHKPARLQPRYLPLAATISLFVLMGTLGSVFYDGFFSLQVFLNLLIDNAFLCVVAVGMTFVILSGGIDLSVGSVIALTTMVSASLVEKHGFSPLAVIPLVLLTLPLTVTCASEVPPSAAQIRDARSNLSLCIDYPHVNEIFLGPASLERGSHTYARLGKKSD